MGSEKGTPSSIMSAPPSCMARRTGTVSWGVGYPAVTKVTSAEQPYTCLNEGMSGVNHCYLCPSLGEYSFDVVHLDREKGQHRDRGP